MNNAEAEVFRQEREKMNRHDDFMAYMDAAQRRHEPTKGPIELCPRREVVAGIKEEADETINEINAQIIRKWQGETVDKEAVKREAADLGRRAYGAFMWAERNL
jgi:hypothetical protein